MRKARIFLPNLVQTQFYLNTTIMSSKNNYNHDLKALVIHMNDSVKGYEKAADQVRDEDATLARDLKARGQCREALVEKLKKSLEGSDDDPVDRGSVEGSMHRALISVKEMFASNESAAIVKEARRGEKKLADYIADTFDDADEMNIETVSLLREIQEDVDNALQSLRE